MHNNNGKHLKTGKDRKAPEGGVELLNIKDYDEGQKFLRNGQIKQLKELLKIIDIPPEKFLNRAVYKAKYECIKQLYSKLLNRCKTQGFGLENDIFTKALNSLYYLCSMVIEAHKNDNFAKILNAEKKVQACRFIETRLYTTGELDVSLVSLQKNFTNKYCLFIQLILEDAIYQLKNNKEKIYILFQFNQHEKSDRLVVFSDHKDCQFKQGELLTLFLSNDYQEHLKKTFGQVTKVMFFSFENFHRAVNDNISFYGSFSAPIMARNFLNQNRVIFGVSFPSGSKDFSFEINKKFIYKPKVLRGEKNFRQFFGYKQIKAGNMKPVGKCDNEFCKKLLKYLKDYDCINEVCIVRLYVTDEHGGLARCNKFGGHGGLSEKLSKLTINPLFRKEVYYHCQNHKLVARENYCWPY